MITDEKVTIDIIFDNMINKIITTEFAKKNLAALYANPRFLKQEDKWIDFYYQINKNNPSVKECLNFEKEISLLFADENISCGLSHIDYAPIGTKEGGCVWEA